jgi:DNA-binding GntR family transcriptional regulator
MSALESTRRDETTNAGRRKTAARSRTARRDGNREFAPKPGSADARFSRAAWLAKVLTDRIVDATYAPGERILEAALQQEFGFSNGPVREALQRVVADGLADRSPWRGVRVIALGEKEIASLFELRAALLEYAAELAARRADAAAVRSAEALRKSLAKKFVAARSGRPLPVTGDTTDWVMSVAKNSQILEVWRTTMLRSRIYVYRSMKQTAGAHTEPIIAELVEAILRKKQQAARRAARALTEQMLSDLGISPAQK